MKYILTIFSWKYPLFCVVVITLWELARQGGISRESRFFFPSSAVRHTHTDYYSQLSFWFHAIIFYNFVVILTELKRLRGRVRCSLVSGMAMVGAAHRPAGPQLLTLEGGLSPVDPLAADKGLFLEGLCSALGSESMAAESSFMLNYSLSMFRTLCSLYIEGWIFLHFWGFPDFVNFLVGFSDSWRLHGWVLLPWALFTFESIPP